MVFPEVLKLHHNLIKEAGLALSLGEGFACPKIDLVQEKLKNQPSKLHHAKKTHIFKHLELNLVE